MYGGLFVFDTYEYALLIISTIISLPYIIILIFIHKRSTYFYRWHDLKNRLPELCISHAIEKIFITNYFV